MIYEVRTYNLLPHSVPEFEKRFGEAYEKRKNYSPLAAFWHTEIGPLNQIIHVWPYKDVAERDRIRAAAVKDGVWPPKTSEFIVAQQSDIMIPFPISPEIEPGNVGPYFEIRTYTYAAGELPKIMKLWEKAMPARLALSPVTAIWYSDVGSLSKFVHIWPYKSMEERNEVRRKGVATGVWPPSSLAKREGLPTYRLLSQENKIVMPSAFSPLQ